MKNRIYVEKKMIPQSHEAAIRITTMVCMLIVGFFVSKVYDSITTEVDSEARYIRIDDKN